MFYKKLIVCIFFSFICKAEVIIFDLYGVLFTIPLVEQIKHMGTLPLKYLFFDHKDPRGIKFLLFNVLDQVHVGAQYDLAGNSAQVLSERAMSPVMYLWQANKINGKVAHNLVLDHIDALSKQNFFSSVYEQEFLRKSADMVFDFNIRKSAWKPISSGINLLMRCAAEKDKNGNQKHKLYILSNMDPEMLHYLQESYPNVFKLFDGIITSGETGFLKPDSKIYQELITRFKIDPQEAIFIDDQQENIDGALKAGIRGILCRDFTQVSNQLVQMGIIAPKPFSVIDLLSSPKIVAAAFIAIFMLKKYLP